MDARRVAAAAQNGNGLSGYICTSLLFLPLYGTSPGVTLLEMKRERERKGGTRRERRLYISFRSSVALLPWGNYPSRGPFRAPLHTSFEANGELPRKCVHGWKQATDYNKSAFRFNSHIQPACLLETLTPALRLTPCDWQCWHHETKYRTAISSVREHHKGHFLNEFQFSCQVSPKIEKS